MFKEIGPVLLLLGLLNLHAPAAEVPGVCNSIPIKLGVMVPASVGTLDHLELNRQRRFTEATISFVNSGSRNADRIFVLAEFLDSAQHHMLSLPLNAVAQSKRFEKESPIKLSGLQEKDIPSSVGTASAVSLYGYSPMNTRDCPAEAVLSYVEILYADGTKFTSFLPNWHSDAVPYKVPNASPRLLKGSSFQSVTTMRINQDGHVVLAEAKTLTAREKSDLQKLMDAWIFLPAVDSGLKIESTVHMLVYRGECSPATPIFGAESSIWIRVEICSNGMGPAGQEVYVGGFLQ